MKRDPVVTREYDKCCEQIVEVKLSTLLVNPRTGSNNIMMWLKGGKIDILSLCKTLSVMCLTGTIIKIWCDGLGDYGCGADQPMGHLTTCAMDTQ